jgi:hypothetical protein
MKTIVLNGKLLVQCTRPESIQPLIRVSSARFTRKRTQRPGRTAR